MSTITEEEENYARISLLLSGVSQRAARAFFDKEFSPKCLDSSIKKASNELKRLKYKTINLHQWDLLFPVQGLPDSKTFDVTLIITLLRNLTDLITTQAEFDKLPSSTDTTPSAALATIKYYRNCIAHNIDGKIKNSFFDKAWHNISGAVRILGGKKMLDECEKLRHKTLERSTVPWNVRARITFRLEKWKIEDGNFIKTRAAEYVFGCIQENSCVTITASSGVGKTATLHNVVLKMIDEGYDALLVTNPQDIVKYYNPHQKTLFVIDDFCGTYSINQYDLDSWESAIVDVKECIQQKVTKIIVACRLQVYQDEKFDALSIFTTNVCNLLSKDLCLTQIEKQSIAELYLDKRFSEIMQYCDEYDCFPLLCKLYSENPEKHNIIHFFKNPYSVFEAEIDQLKKKGFNKKYCALALCVMFDNALKEQLFTDDIDFATTVIKNTCLACRLDEGTSSIALLDELKSLEHMFIKNEQGVYKTKHDKLFDFLAFYFGQKMIACLIKNAHSKIISQKMLFNETYVMDQLIPIIPSELHHIYIDRVINDWSKGKLRYIFNNINLKIPEFRNRFLIQFHKLDISYQEKLACVRDDKDNGTVLLHCCYSGVLLPLIQEVLNHGVDVNLCNCLGISPLLVSVMRGHTEIVRLLLDQMADTNMCESKGLSPLYVACQTGQLKVAKLLIENKADINKCLFNGASSLYIACQEKRVEIVKLLLNNNADMNQCVFNGISPLYLACKDNYIEVVKLLTDNKADTNKCTDDGTSPLYIACQNNHIEIVKILLDNNADVNKCRDNSKFPLYVACNNNHVEIVKALLDNKADVNQCDEKRTSPLFLACFLNNEEIVQLLLDYKADIDIKCTNNELSPLYIACCCNHKEIVKLLIDRGANLNMSHLQKQSPLYIACQNKHIDVVKLLLDNADLCLKQV